MIFIRFKIAAGVLHVPAHDIRSILKRADGSALVTFKSSETEVVVPDGDKLIKSLEVGLEPTKSIFETIFGK